VSDAQPIVAPIERDADGNIAFKLAAMPGVGSVMSQVLPRQRHVDQNPFRCLLANPFYPD
jgi:hypothetical protein